jgi:hypothetical protein
MTAPIRVRPGLSPVGVAVPGGNAAGCTAQLPPGTHVVPGLPREDAALLAGLPVRERGGVAVVRRAVSWIT